jgi:hypothetical protein
MKSSRLKVIFWLSFLVLFSVVAGFFLGVLAEKAVAKKREQPAAWRKAALKHLAKLSPTPAQQQGFEQKIDAAVGELTVLKRHAEDDVWRIVERTVSEVEKDLTPEQVAKFAKIRPRQPAAKEPSAAVERPKNEVDDFSPIPPVSAPR